MIVREGQIWRKISDVKKDDSLRLIDCNTDYEVVKADNIEVVIRHLKHQYETHYILERFEDNFIYIFTPGEEEDKPKNKYHRNLKVPFLLKIQTL